MSFTVLCGVILALCGGFAVGQLSENRDELLNWCLKSQTHKHKPGKEDSLHQQCLPWKEHSCCTSEVSQDVHSETNAYNFTLDHCRDARNGKMMSARCRQYFLRNNCFYECEPHIGLWVVKARRKFSSERFFKAPLCASDCNEWFDACREDFTCAYNWPRDFKFVNGHNMCPAESKCISFKETYTSAQDFCENVWDGSWKYTPDNEKCLHIWFDGANPNRKVAEYYIDQQFPRTGGAQSLSLNAILTCGLLAPLLLRKHQ